VRNITDRFELIRAIETAQRGRRKGSRRIKTAWLPSDSFRSLVRGEHWRVPQDCWVAVRWGRVAVVERDDKTEGNARYL